MPPAVNPTTVHQPHRSSKGVERNARKPKIISGHYVPGLIWKFKHTAQDTARVMLTKDQRQTNRQPIIW
jgi:hypothetical protein